jgi:hypothetical protein
VPGNRYPYRDSDYVYENKRVHDNLAESLTDFYAKLHGFRKNRGEY